MIHTENGAAEVHETIYGRKCTKDFCPEYFEYVEYLRKNEPDSKPWTATQARFVNWMLESAKEGVIPLIGKMPFDEVLTYLKK